MNKLMIVGLEGGASGVTVEAQFNPKELSLDSSIAWRLAKWEGPDLDSLVANPKAMSFELLFDSFESGSPIQDTIGTLRALSDVDAGLKRPPKVKVVWGTEGAPGMIPKFEGVVESMNVKYTMFDSDGKPLRATVGVRLIEARKITMVKPRS